MALQRYSHTGAAPATGLSSNITSSSASFGILSSTGYPTGSAGLFVLVLDPGTASEEKVLCSSISGTTVSVASGGRGYDSTVAAAHNSGTTNVQHVWSAAEADDASRHIYGVLPGPTLSDDHTNYALLSGSRAFTAGVTMDAGLIVTNEAEAADFNASGLSGATAGARFVGGTASGAPASGTFLQGDFVADQTGAFWVCTVGGSPGTWVEVAAGGGGGGSVSSIIAGDNIVVSGATGNVTVSAELGYQNFVLGSPVTLSSETHTSILGPSSTPANGAIYLLQANLLLKGNGGFPVVDFYFSTTANSYVGAIAATTTESYLGSGSYAPAALTALWISTGSPVYLNCYCNNATGVIESGSELLGGEGCTSLSLVRLT
jgi:hypothetical protein